MFAYSKVFSAIFICLHTVKYEKKAKNNPPPPQKKPTELSNLIMQKCPVKQK